MNLTLSILEALESLNANRLRSGLTMLGIIIGVGAVIAMLSVGQGAQATITSAISGIGTNLLFVSSGNLFNDVRNPKPLTLADAEAMADPLVSPDVAGVAPSIQGSADVSSTFGKTRRSSITGVTPDYFTMQNYKITEGSFITGEHILGQASVAVIGPTISDQLYGRHEGVVGETIRVSGQPFRVIGVLASKGGSGFGNQDSHIYIPISTAQARLFHRATFNEVDQILVQAVSSNAVSQATDEISQVLRQRHRTPVGIDDFTVFSQKDVLSIATTVTGVFTIFLGGIAGISLLVGGIGIMNIMLVSVTERTREIGLRKALGARKRDILLQFLTESSMMSLFGGVIGILLGWLLSLIIGRIAVATGNSFSPVIGINSILLATLFSAAVGLFFGIYPASRAANLEPVEALRYE
jgi:putative ABC transport system permease protein